MINYTRICLQNLSSMPSEDPEFQKVLTRWQIKALLYSLKGISTLRSVNAANTSTIIQNMERCFAKKGETILGVTGCAIDIKDLSESIFSGIVIPKITHTSVPWWVLFEEEVESTMKDL